MPTGTLLLVLASATLHACWNLWAKQIRSSARGGSIAWLLTALSAAIYAPVVLALVGTGRLRIGVEALPWILGSSVLHVIYFLVLLRGYRVGDLSVVYPAARGTGPLWAAAGGVLLFHETPTPLSIAGTVLIAIGVLALTAHRSEATGGSRRAGIAYGLFTGFLIGAYTVWDGWAVQRVALPPLLYYWSGELMRVPLLTPLAVADRDGLRKVWGAFRGRILAIAILSPLSYLLMLFALRDGAVSHVAPVREIGILIGTWLGGQVLGEGDRRRRLAAALAMVAGVILLAMAT